MLNNFESILMALLGILRKILENLLEILKNSFNFKKYFLKMLNNFQLISMKEKFSEDFENFFFGNFEKKLSYEK